MKKYTSLRPWYLIVLTAAKVRNFVTIGYRIFMIAILFDLEKKQYILLGLLATSHGVETPGGNMFRFFFFIRTTYSVV